MFFNYTLEQPSKFQATSKWNLRLRISVTITLDSILNLMKKCSQRFIHVYHSFLLRRRKIHFV